MYAAEMNGKIPARQGNVPELFFDGCSNLKFSDSLNSLALLWHRRDSDEELCHVPIKSQSFEELREKLHRVRDSFFYRVNFDYEN